MKFILQMALFISASSAFAETPRILFIGDSHVAGRFGSTMDELLTQVPNAQIASYGSCGSIAQGWMKNGKTTCGAFSHVHSATEITAPHHTTSAPTPQIQELLASFKPNYLIVELGANYGPVILDQGGSLSKTRADLKQFVQIIRDAGVKCLWVSMPDSRRLKPQQAAILEETQDAIRGVCEFFDSTSVTSYPATGGDGIHYAGPVLNPMAEGWASAAFQHFKDLFFE